MRFVFWMHDKDGNPYLKQVEASTGREACCKAGVTIEKDSIHLGYYDTECERSQNEVYIFNRDIIVDMQQLAEAILTWVEQDSEFKLPTRMNKSEL